MGSYELTGDFVVFVVGAIIALLLWWAPGFATLWSKVTVKRVTLFSLFLLVPVAFTLVGCYAPFASKVSVTCVTSGDTLNALLINIGGALKLGIIALAGSQGGYMALVQWGQDLLHTAHIKTIDDKTEQIAALIQKFKLTPDDLIIIAHYLQSLNPSAEPRASPGPAESENTGTTNFNPDTG